MELFNECIRYVEGLAKVALKDVEQDLLISIGGSTIGRDFEFVVREMPEDVEISDRSTSTAAPIGSRPRGCYQVEFSVACQAWAKQSGVERAASLVNGWVERFVSAIAADRTLGGLVAHADPYIGRGGSAYENNRAVYLAAIDFGVRVKARIDPLPTQ